MISKYAVAEIPNGFTISAKDRNFTTVELVGGNIPYFSVNGYHIQLIEYRSLMKKISDQLFKYWKPKVRNEQSIRFVPGWILNECQKAIGKRVHAQWKRLLDKCDQNVINIQRKVFSVHGRLPEQMQCFPGFYQHKYLTKDILSLRSACAAVYYAYICGGHIKFFHTNYDKIKPEEWMRIFSCEDKVYPALGKTLNDLSGGIPVKSLNVLAFFKLKRPLLTRLELCLNLALFKNCYSTKMYFDVFHFATPQDIRLAAKKVGDHLRSRFNLRKFSEIIRLTQFLADYPEGHNGGLPGLAEKSIHWHRHQAQAHACQELERLGLEGCSLAKLPPVPLPQNKGIKFLATAQDILEEGKNQAHCVGSYVERSIKGSCFLFHVDIFDQTATVEVAWNGDVVQSYGPKNSINKASKYGQKVLKQWGKTFPTIHQPAHDPFEVDNELPF